MAHIDAHNTESGTVAVAGQYLVVEPSNNCATTNDRPILTSPKKITVLGGEICGENGANTSCSELFKL